MPTNKTEALASVRAPLLHALSVRSTFIENVDTTIYSFHGLMS